MKPTNYQSLIDQMDNLIEILNRHLHTHKNLKIKELVIDFVQDYSDGKFYFLQFKYIDTYIVPEQDDYLKQRGFSPPKDKALEAVRMLKTLGTFNGMMKENFECAGDYCTLDGILSRMELPRIH